MVELPGDAGIGEPTLRAALLAEAGSAPPVLLREPRGDTMPRGERSAAVTG